jgi:hypothetical protein
VDNNVDLAEERERLTGINALVDRDQVHQRDAVNALLGYWYWSEVVRFADPIIAEAFQLAPQRR